MISDLETITATLAQAKSPEDVFGPLSYSHELTAVWRRLVKLTHPDGYADDPAAATMAEKAFDAINEWKAKAIAKIALGSYGDGKPHDLTPPPPPAPASPVTITIGKSTYVTGPVLFEGDVATLYACTGPQGDVLFKIARSAADNDLMEAEHRSLSAIWHGQKNEGDARLLPILHDSFLLKGKGPARLVNILSRHDDHFSLAEVLAAYSNGIDFRDWAWMFKRTLSALGIAHRKGIVHGAVLPTHVLIHPVHHGAKLVGWGYSVPQGERLRAIVSAHKTTIYGHEVLRRLPVTAATDLYMLAKGSLQLLGGDAAQESMPDRVPKSVQAFLHGCLFASPSRRPSDAWALLAEFDDLLARVVGPRVYRPFHMPAPARS